MRLAIALLLCLAVVFAFTATTVAEGKEVNLKGKITCAKCELKVQGQTKCATVIVVKEGGKDVVYYFDDAAHKKHHEEICKEGKPGSVKGTVAEKDGKKVVTATDVKFE